MRVFLGCAIPCYFEPTNFLWDSYIANWMPGRHYAAEGRRTVAVTHLALLGVKIAGNGTLGVLLQRINGFTKENLRRRFERGHCRTRKMLSTKESFRNERYNYKRYRQKTMIMLGYKREKAAFMAAFSFWENMGILLGRRDYNLRKA